MRACAPGANNAPGTLEMRRSTDVVLCRAMRLTNAEFPCECDIHNVIVHVTRFVFVQSAKAKGREEYCYMDGAIGNQ